jgi:hypothetical protein
MLADCVGVLIVHDTAHGTSTPFHYVMYTLLNKDNPTMPLLVHGYLPVLNLVDVACQLIGHAASIGHTYLVGRNRKVWLRESWFRMTAMRFCWSLQPKA